VRAAIDAQRAIQTQPQARRGKPTSRTQNVARCGRGQPPLAMLNLLALGSGINTGMAMVD